jgi:peptide/nickel transport system substrate-binding protein
MLRRTVLGGGAALTLLQGTTAHAQTPAAPEKHPDLLRIAWRDAIPDLDPYYNQLRVGLVVAHHAWDCLIYRDPTTFQINPLLAIAWRYVDQTTLEFDLRRGVVFHDGSPFTAADVVYTVNTVLTDPRVLVPSNFSWLDGAEKIDDFKVRLKLKRVFPAALEYLAMVLPIWPKAYREAVGPDAYSRAPIGAGPYRITRASPESNIVLDRFDAYYAASPKGRPAIARLEIHTVSDSAGELDALLHGRADWIWSFPSEMFDAINGSPSLVAVRQESMRIGYISMDAAGRSGADNPMTKLKVRQAVCYAIDRQTIARDLVQGGARVLDAPCFPTQFGCEAAFATRYDYDPAKARQLLTDAGYPNGFDTELVTYLLADYGEAVASYLRAAGIRATLTRLPIAEAVRRAGEGLDPMDMGSWGSYSINDVSAIFPYFFGGTSMDSTGNAELSKLVQQGGSTTDVDERRRVYSAAIQLITANAYWLPMNTYITNYGFSRMLNFRPYADELPRFFLASWR